ncbi:putative thioredoxin h [Fragilariopsis cylindrus CCMP1102]|uniref:Putative thioredoxin h n=1 Tax=Fragilariopsis cylindrus CCMP1102 TaxID=635003 RepID=A0A1E7F1D9_9STRA|nr:putative thioredoxin h [Fragilariopsis cylindrus CCMP1102]|eukprot:OEU12011.1 putative thioredoxin h [Fragilariopsis cylindrus CCMP1102]
MVNHVGSLKEWCTLMETSKEKLVVVDFTATWCGPCKQIAPIFAKMAEEYPDAEFVRVEVEDADDVAEACGIQAMLTFQFFKDGNKVDELLGAHPNKLGISSNT